MAVYTKPTYKDEYDISFCSQHPERHCKQHCKQKISKSRLSCKLNFLGKDKLGLSERLLYERKPLGIAHQCSMLLSNTSTQHHALPNCIGLEELALAIQTQLQAKSNERFIHRVFYSRRPLAIPALPDTRPSHQTIPISTRFPSLKYPPFFLGGVPPSSTRISRTQQPKSG